MKIQVKNLAQTEELAENFAKLIQKCGVFVCLYGDIGVGKTAFTRFVLQKLGVKEKVTSPSFVILNEYHSGKIPCYHFDLYRLEKENAQTIKDELQEYSHGKILTIIEWAQFSDISKDFERIEVNISYVDENKRTFEFSAFGEKHNKILKELASCTS